MSGGRGRVRVQRHDGRRPGKGPREAPPTNDARDEFWDRDDDARRRSLFRSRRSDDARNPGDARDPRGPREPNEPRDERGRDHDDDDVDPAPEPRRRPSALGLGGAAPATDRWIDGGGRWGTAAHDPILGWYEPDAPTLELPIAEELARLRAAGVIDPAADEAPTARRGPGDEVGPGPDTGRRGRPDPGGPTGPAGPGPGAPPGGRVPSSRGPAPGGPGAPAGPGGPGVPAPGAPPIGVPAPGVPPVGVPAPEVPDRPGAPGAPEWPEESGAGPGWPHERSAPGTPSAYAGGATGLAEPATSAPGHPPTDRPDDGYPAAEPPTGPQSEQIPVVLPEPIPAEPPPESGTDKAAASRKSSFLVAAGILLSRTAGLIREVAIGGYLGTTAAADAFKAALRIPNLMQNLLGEGVLSASFIPVYAKLRSDGDEKSARQLAASVAGLLVAMTGLISLIGVLFARPITTVLVTGWSDEKFDLTVELVRIMFPGIGFLVLSAWCLGVLNSHRKFFLSYVAPVLWNAAQIGLLVAVALTGAGTRDLAVALSYGVLIGGVAQLAIQLPAVHQLLGHIRFSLRTRHRPVRSVIGRFGPVVMGRGVVQILGYVDLWLASFLADGAVSTLTFGQVLYLLPISVFGMSVAAAELPDLSSVQVHDPDTRRDFRRRMEAGMARILFYVAPTTTLFIVVGDVIARALFQRGQINSADTYAIWLVVAAFSLGLPATTASRLQQNALYALGDARTPARLAALRVVIAAVVGLALMFPFDRLTIVDGNITGWGDMLALGPLPPDVRDSTGGIPHLGIVGLALGAAVSSWVEYRLLSTALAWRIGRSHLGGRWLNPIAAGCLAMAIVALAALLVFGDRHAIIAAALVLGPAGVTYLAITRRLGVPEAEVMTARLSRLRRR
ncbi:MAG TPA: murein biosynthesis integral membrane protein MurJ [Acidimicrobiales bacterium]|nr:murein biosynthesis integral membrane protein MurJ [Acidimicrobiales bacterium]